MPHTETTQFATEALENGLAGADDVHERVFRMIYGASVTQMLRCLALYSFADHLAGGPATPETIAMAEGLNIDATRRLMRACVPFGLMTESAGGYESTALLAKLEKDNPWSLRHLAICQGGHSSWAPWGLMDRALETGDPQAEAALGMSVWSYLATPQGAVEGEAVAALMGGVFSAVDRAAAERLNTRGLGIAADIGGAQGSLLRALMQANPELRGALLDLPHVAESATQLADNIALGDRLTIEGGNFFESVPQADLYLMRTILHDWSDKECLAILRRCRRSARAGARLVVIENVLGDGPTQSFTAQLDLTMLVQLGGRERTLAQYGDLLSEAGFQIESCAVLCPPFSMIEAVAV